MYVFWMHCHQNGETLQQVSIPRNIQLPSMTYGPIITPSSHIYPSNRPTRVNMWQEATMIWFNLLIPLKEVETTKHNQIDHPCILQDLTQLPHLYRWNTPKETQQFKDLEPHSLPFQVNQVTEGPSCSYEPAWVWL